MQTQTSRASQDEIRKIKSKIQETENCINAIEGLKELADLLEEIDLLSPSEHALRLAQLLNTIEAKMEILKVPNRSSNQREI